MPDEVIILPTDGRAIDSGERREAQFAMRSPVKSTEMNKTIGEHSNSSIFISARRLATMIDFVLTLTFFFCKKLFICNCQIYVSCFFYFNLIIGQDINYTDPSISKYIFLTLHTIAVFLLPTYST